MADAKEYISCPDELGTIHISEEVLAVTAAAAALEVEGVGGLSGNLGSDLMEILAGRKNLGKGVRVTMNDGTVCVDVSILAKYGFSVQDVAKHVQNGICAAIENASGLTVGGVNVHVSGVAFDHPQKTRA